MPCSVRKMREALLGKLECEQVEGRKHTKYRVYKGEKVVAWRAISRGVSELSDSIFGRISKELCVPTRVLRKIYDCPYGLAEYRQYYDPSLNPYYIHHAQSYASTHTKRPRLTTWAFHTGRNSHSSMGDGASLQGKVATNGKPPGKNRNTDVC